MAVGTVSDFTATLARAHLLEPAQLEEVASHLQSQFPEPRALAGELLRRDWLTPFQVNQLFKGNGAELLLGSYVLLKRLGEGGMGEVYKARNWKLGKIVALKLIRQERISDDNMLRRFQREVRAAAQLNHPNVVHAYDCDEAGGKYFLVMEYVDGVDLSYYVKRHGPLLVAQACDCIRQAALGLQHAFECGLVHRDIKPHNLLVARPSGEGGSKGAIVKILDMGLARVSQAAGEEDTTSSMTKEGAVMGTLDYMAPEQAMDAHSADTRSDLYSLGCTFYFLLTGQVPFPGGSAMEKLLRHQNKRPTPVEELRQNIPRPVAVIVNKLMAKAPEDRYRTPAEVVAALSQIDSLAETVIEPTGKPGVSAAEALIETSNSWSSLLNSEDSPEIVSASDLGARKVSSSGKKYLLFAGIGLLAGLAALPLVFRRETPPEQQGPSPTVQQKPHKEKPAPTFDEWLHNVSELPADQQIKEVVSMLKKRNPGFDGTVTPTTRGSVLLALEFHNEHVLDLRPLGAVPQLQTLNCSGTRENPGKLSSLAPLKDMKLTGLNCSFTRVADLSPLQGMPLQWLICASTQVTDLAPLREMPLTTLNLNGNSQLKDLSPLRGLSLNALFCQGTKVSDLTPLQGMPLTTLACPAAALRDQATLRLLTTLKMLNGRPIAQFWKQASKTPLPPKDKK
ncbi:MAG TPA: protein kinase [Gemmataceae bacterium]|jgi:serine/threonine-protein kinase